MILPYIYDYKFRMQEILRDADIHGEQMESIEAKKVALKDGITLLVAQEKRRILGLMEVELSKHEEAFRIQLLESADQEKKQQELCERVASSIITKASRIWLARLSVMREYGDTFEKLFDEEYHAFFYKNRRTVRYFKMKCLILC